MKAITLTLLCAFFFASTVVAQTDSTQQKKEERNFRKLWIEFGGGSSRSLERIDPEHSSWGSHNDILSSWNITDNHSVGVKMVWSFPGGEEYPEHFSLMANYQFTHFTGLKKTPVEEKRVFGFYGGTGIGFLAIQKDSLSKSPSKTSFAMMPYLGIRYWLFYLNGIFHFAADNKQNSYFGFSAGLFFGGGLINKH
jgi:hypothetical protein